MRRLSLAQRFFFDAPLLEADERLKMVAACPDDFQFLDCYAETLARASVSRAIASASRTPRSGIPCWLANSEKAANLCTPPTPSTGPGWKPRYLRDNCAPRPVTSGSHRPQY